VDSHDHNVAFCGDGTVHQAMIEFSIYADGSFGDNRVSFVRKRDLDLAVSGIMLRSRTDTDC
jgi:hypothetical protein